MHKSLIILSLTLLLFSCKHDNIEPILGPDLNQSGLLCPSDNFSFEYNESTTSALDLGNSALQTTVDLSEELSWNYGVTNLKGAEFTESGFGDIISVNWDGSSSNGTFFSAGDSVRLFMALNCLDTVWLQDFTLLTGKEYNATLVSDFDGNGLIGNWSNANNQLVEINIAASDSGAPQGDNYLRLRGVDVGLGSYLGQAMASPTTANHGLTTSADSLYLNAVVRGSSNAILEFRVYENDGDWYFYQQPIDWTGWQVVSFKYTDFTPTVDLGGRDPSDIKQVRITLRSDNPTPEVVANIDFLSFTQGQALIP